MAGAREIVVKIVGDNSKLDKTLRESESSLGKFGNAALKVGGILAGGFVATQAVDFLNNAAKAAAEDAKQQTILAQTLQNVTGATKAQVAATEEWITKTQFATGISDSQLRPALQNLVVATGDITSAQQLMTNAMDIATAKGLDLETVTKAMAKAHDGNTGALAKLGIETKNTAGEALSFEEIMKNANATFGGATQAAAETTAGKMKIMQEKFGELTEEIGTAVLPIMEKFVNFATAHLIPVIEDFAAMLSGMPSDIGDSIAVILNNISQGFATALNFLIDRANNVIDLLNDINPLSDPLDRIANVTGHTYIAGPRSFKQVSTPEEIAAFAAMVTAQNPDFVGPSRAETNADFARRNPGEPGFVGPVLPVYGPKKPVGLAAGGITRAEGLAYLHKNEIVQPLRNAMGTFNIATLNVSANNPTELVAALQEYARRNGGLRLSGGVTAVS